MLRKYLYGILCFLVASAIVAWYVHTHWSDFVLFDAAGPVALSERNVMFVTFLLCCIVIVPVFVMLFSFAWLYREGHPRARRLYFPNWDHHTRLAEAIWWFVPALIIAILAGLAWQSTHALDPYVPLGAHPLRVQVVALDWKWLFVYPDQGIASVNDLEIPVDTPVALTLTADAPMNSFWVPQLSGQIMVMPGMSTELNLEASRTGDFKGYSGNISGTGFAGMAFTVHALPRDAFASWVAEVRLSATSTLDAMHYAALEKPSTYNAPVQYSSVAPELYDSIIMRYMSPASTTRAMPMQMQ